MHLIYLQVNSEKGVLIKRERQGGRIDGGRGEREMCTSE